mmetsp:Transcript_17165/g.43926  ORF Transcript_17165/g.43926 Transcript_17165/m.43926 type:complete len:127 (+) Transcript_17165:311-691(+)
MRKQRSKKGLPGATRTDGRSNEGALEREPCRGEGEGLHWVRERRKRGENAEGWDRAMSSAPIILIRQQLILILSIEVRGQQLAIPQLLFNEFLEWNPMPAERAGSARAVAPGLSKVGRDIKSKFKT